MTACTEADLIAKPIGSQVHIRFANQPFVWHFTKTTARNWKRTNKALRPQWADHEQLAYLITEGTQTNSLGEAL